MNLATREDYIEFGIHFLVMPGMQRQGMHVVGGGTQPDGCITHSRMRGWSVL